MDKNAIKKYAVWARRELISRVSGRAAQYGVTEEGWGDANADSVNGHVLSDTEKRQRIAFIKKVKSEGYEQAVEEVAYTWFNRFCALRYMEVNGYLPSHVRVFTNEAGEFKPEIIDEALHLDIEGLDMDKVLSLKEDAQKTEELFRYLLITQCNALNSILPGMFQKIEDYTELLLPENLLREGSVIEQLITQIPEEDWTDQVQIIGWLYQYYNAEKKDEVFAALKKNVKITKENIPAATQLFTPDWIVRYMVENSLGRLWVEGHPNDELKSGWKYYLEEAAQEPEVETQLVEIRKEYAKLKPKDIKCIDPCCGSGHILCYMFDVLMQIYESYGYTTQEAVSSIIENNIYGLDIDERAAQLAYFAVMMKARSYDRRFFSRGIQPHVYAICESNELDQNVIDYFVGNDPILKKDFGTLVEEMHDAKEYGSILNPSLIDFTSIYERIEEVKEDINFYAPTVLDQIAPLIHVSELLSGKYHIVVTNPPYMGNSSMGDTLLSYVKAKFPDSKTDLFSVFIERCANYTLDKGYYALITQPSFLFLSSFTKLRTKIIKEKQVISLLDMGRGIFGIDFGSTAFVIRNVCFEKYKGGYSRLNKKIFQFISIEDIEKLYLYSKNNVSAFFDFDKYYIQKEVCFDNCGQRLFFIANQSRFLFVPNHPFAYWVSDNLLYSFKTCPKLKDVCEIKHGMSTGNNDLILHSWMEVKYDDICFNAKSHGDFEEKNGKYAPYNKGGDYRKWYGNQWYVIGYNKEYNSLMDTFSGHRHDNKDFYFHAGFTWSTVSSGNISVRYTPEGYIFDSKGSMGFVDEKKTLLGIMAFLNSKVCTECLKVLSPTIDFNAGSLQQLPYLEQGTEVVDLTRQNIEISRTEWDSFETSWDFKEHPLVRWSKGFWDITCTCANYDYFYPGQKPDFRSPLKLSWLLWKGECDRHFNKLKTNEEELNRIFIDIYDLQDELTPEEDDKDVTVRKADLQRDVKSLISYAVGCMFGRYSLDVDGLAFAGGEWDPSKYKTYQPDYNGILPICDDEYFQDDIVGHFVDFIRTVYGEDTLEENLQFIADALGGSGSSRKVIRKYFLNDFYADHCKTYQKRPIYWLFDSGKKNGFKCLIYIHRYRPDTIARIRTDYVHEQQARYRTEIADVEKRVTDASTSDRIKLNKQLKKLQDQSDELLGYEEKIHHLADQFIDIDLDDGVKVNYAKFQDVLAKIK